MTDKKTKIHLNHAAAAVIFITVFFSLAFTINDPGMGWDEGNDIAMAKGAYGWFHEIGDRGTHPFSRDKIEQFWGYEWKQHPSVSRIFYASVYSISHNFGSRVEFIQWKAFRYGSFLIFAALVVLVFYFGATYFKSMLAGIAAAVALGCMPRMFGHAHFVETDLVLCSIYFAAAFAFLWGLKSKWGALAFGILMGLLPAVKFSGFFAIVPFFLFGLIFERRKVLRNALAASVVAPLVFLIVQPMYWHTPVQSFFIYLKHFLNPGAQSTIVTCYFGEYYQKSPPWTYPFAITALSIPLATLLLAFAGIAAIFKLKSETFKITVYCIFNAFFILFMFAPRRVAIYDGERLVMSVFPFWALLAGAGFAFLTSRLRLTLALMALFVYFVASAFTVSDSRPYYLCYYNALVGGTVGAERRGLEVMYWGEAFTPELARLINENIPAGARITTIGYFSGNFKYFQDMGLLRKDLNIVDYGGDADFVLVFNRMGVLDPFSTYLLKNVKPLIGVDWKNIPLAGVYTTQYGYELMKKSNTGK
jgi:hypothetical protein